jgi:hypothetical protein
VDGRDFLIFLSSSDPSADYYDLTNDGVRDFRDVALFVIYWERQVGVRKD